MASGEAGNTPISKRMYRVANRHRDEVGARIKERRKDAAMTQSEMAKLLGVHSVTVSNWERGRQIPAAARLEEVARVLDCDPYFIYFGQEPGEKYFEPKARQARARARVRPVPRRRGPEG